MDSDHYNKMLLSKRLTELQAKITSLTNDICKATELIQKLGNIIHQPTTSAIVKVSDYTHVKSSLRNSEYIVKRDGNHLLSSYHQIKLHLTTVIEEMELRRKTCAIEIAQIRERLMIMEDNRAEQVEQVQENAFKIYHGELVEIIEVDPEPYVRKQRVAHHPKHTKDDGQASPEDLNESS